MFSFRSHGFYFFPHFTWNHIVLYLSGDKRWLPFCSESTKLIQLFCLLLSNGAGLPRRISLHCQIPVPFLISDQGESLLMGRKTLSPRDLRNQKKMNRPKFCKNAFILDKQIMVHSYRGILFSNNKKGPLMHKTWMHVTRVWKNARHKSMYYVYFILCLWNPRRDESNLKWQKVGSGYLELQVGVVWDGAQGTFRHDGNAPLSVYWLQEKLHRCKLKWSLNGCILLYVFATSTKML